MREAAQRHTGQDAQQQAQEVTARQIRQARHDVLGEAMPTQVSRNDSSITGIVGK